MTNCTFILYSLCIVWCNITLIEKLPASLLKSTNNYPVLCNKSVTWTWATSSMTKYATGSIVLLLIKIMLKWTLAMCLISNIKRATANSGNGHDVHTFVIMNMFESGLLTVDICYFYCTQWSLLNICMLWMIYDCVLNACQCFWDG